MRRLALLGGCLLIFACSDGKAGDRTGQGGFAGGQGGLTGGGSGGSIGGGTGGSTGGGSGGSIGGAGGAGGATATGGSGGAAGGSGGAIAGSGGTAGGGGHAGAPTGTGGTAGAAGQGGYGGASASCSQLAATYTAAFLRARTCDVRLSTAQCAHLVQSSLICGCQAWVNDTSELDPIAAQWSAAGCVAGLCDVVCPSPGTRAVCVSIDSGDVCMGE